MKQVLSTLLIGVMLFLGISAATAFASPYQVPISGAPVCSYFALINLTGSGQIITGVASHYLFRAGCGKYSGHNSGG